ncbi:MAG: NAD(P)-binding domain-containing protein [Oscillospiraceae bacterium]|nr:NAD(P)-binding domain-containing protein [Oscillospiraceae bacterium]
MRTFAVVGQDDRVQAAGGMLRRMGFEVLEAEQLYRADYILLPMPLEGDRAGLAQLLRAAKPGAIAFRGRVSAAARQAAEDAHICLLDYFEREDLALLNAVPTAEGCLQLLMEHRLRTLWGSPVTVLGCGRVGQAVARRLHALGAAVTVAARSAEQRALAQADGWRAVRLEELDEVLPGCDTVVNTIPAMVLEGERLALLPPGSLIVDLASKPGGTDFEAARALGHTALHALSLPARCAPVTAGELVARAVYAMLQERGELI